ncbi:multidrug resistance-associated protein 4 [Fopius arisanus]|uniref:Multidrug resistance-associated protein 4 n=1 Tax=Fopius arisanus TaxID=64838 RepID=A0A9R1U8D4_9HYME|nr:PREDICTED: multidrug resistance-associated protein 4-like [Fopius arisanus]
MDKTIKRENPNPRKTANVFKKLSFWWLKPFFLYGKKNDLESKDLYNTLPPDLSEPLGDVLEKNWTMEIAAARRTGRKPRLFTAIRKTFMLSHIYYGGLLFSHSMMCVLLPYVLGLLISYFAHDSTITTGEAYGYASLVVIISILMALIDHHSNMGQMEIGMRLRIASSSLIYRKILKLSRSSANKTAGGQIINLLSNDVGRFDQVFILLHYLWISPIQFIVIACLIWQNVQMATLTGIFLLVIQTVPVQTYLSRLTAKLRAKVAVRTDERVRLMSEIITAVQVIKMYTWEKPFLRLVSFARKHEIDVLTVMAYWRGTIRASMVFTERTTLFFTVMTYVLLGNTISAAKVFSMAQYFNRLQAGATWYIPTALTSASEATVTIKRLENFLLLEDNKPQTVEQTSTEAASIKIEQATASWDRASITKTLNNITTTIKSGKLIAVVGPVGAGKSSLLQLILGELDSTAGQVAVGGSVSYASQEPWLFTGSVRNNILFGQPYDGLRYRQVVRACALTRDFIQLPQGDKTLVGERGTSLSGGQRARVNLARAVYRKADIYLFDDPLSAVDAHVSKSLFDECFKEYLGDKTRVLVTHQVQYLKDVDFIIMVNHGRIEKQGSFKNFSPDDFKLLHADTEVEKEEELMGENRMVNGRGLANAVSQISYSSGADKEEEDEEPEETEELMGKGKISRSLFGRYFGASGSYFFLSMFVVLLIAGQLGSSGSDFWVAYWTNQIELQHKTDILQNYSLHIEIARISEDSNTTRIESDFPPPINLTRPAPRDESYDNNRALWIYGMFVMTCTICTTLRNVVFFKICMSASKNLHNLMLECLLQAPMKFFDSNPSGRIVNRFSKDIGCVDELLPIALIDSIQVFAVMVGILSQVVIINWWTIFPMGVMGYFYLKIRSLFLATAQDLKRLEGITKSPVFSHVNASLAGLATIRSAGGQEMLRKEFDSHQDVHTSANSLLISSSAAFGLWLDIVTIVFVAFITYSFIILKNDTTSAGNVGLAISQILILCGMLQYGMRQTAEMTAQMTSVERVLQFTELDKEGPFDSQANAKPPATWPHQGQIKFDHVYFKYSEKDSPVLKDLNINIEPGLKVGVVGRTGAGKSSLIAALFNLAQLEGAIHIDEVDTKKIGLHDLRKKISIIPQEPMLFSATLRDNLDPFHHFKDDQLWAALEDVELKGYSESLDYLVTHGGANFSAGQRQLLCLARAIVRNNKIIVLDEATANVDPATDALIQRTIRDKFKDCTVLTIAHRLNTVMDSDRILVMDHGQAVEYDLPHKLLQKQDGYLKRMVNETGTTMADRLKKIAEDAHTRNGPSDDETPNT